MKLFITALSESLYDDVDASFGRCNFFLIYETEDDSHKFIKNKFQDAQTSVGEAVAQEAINLGAKAVISVNPGPRAFKLLKESQIDVFRVNEGTKLKDAITAFAKNELLALESYIPHNAL